MRGFCNACEAEPNFLTDRVNSFANTIAGVVELADAHKTTDVIVRWKLRPRPHATKYKISPPIGTRHAVNNDFFAAALIKIKASLVFIISPRIHQASRLTRAHTFVKVLIAFI